MSRAYMLAGAPVCPKCLQTCEYTQRTYETQPGKPEPVRCNACEWDGEHIRIIVVGDPYGD